MDLETFKDRLGKNTINRMCYTHRHDYGLDKLPDDHFTSGLTHGERLVIYHEMAQLYDQHFLPLINDLLNVTYPDGNIPDETANKLLK
jgi:hypothetical protein